jgi:two-component system, NtrC family, response regulator AtoC
LDIPRGDGDGLHLLPWLRRLRPELPVVMFCDAADDAIQRAATRLGAKDIMIRPFGEEQLESLVRRHLCWPTDNVEAEMASEDIESLGEDEFFLSVSPAMRQVRTQAELLAQADVPVLILGEPGSGKGTVARLIHQLSVYSGFKFLRVNCAEMPGDLLEIELFGRENSCSNGSSNGARKNGSGKLELGQKGTLLLEEITEMPLAVQSRLLNVLQDKRFLRPGYSKPVEVNVRILASSSDKLDRALAEKKLNPDLYYRLSAFTVQVPPLRQRKEEIKILLRYSMHKLAKYYGLVPREVTESVLQACQNHSWPGNLQELENFAKRYLVAGDQQLALTDKETTQHDDGNLSHKPPMQLAVALRDAVDGGETPNIPKSLKSIMQTVRSETERNAIAGALEKTGWNRKAASRLLGISYRTILYKIEHYQMSASESYPSSFPGNRLGFTSHAKGNGKAS